MTNLLSHIFWLHLDRNAPDMLQRKGTRVNMVPIKMLSPGEKLTEKLNSPT